MKMRLKHIGTRLLSWALILEIALGSTAFGISAKADIGDQTLSTNEPLTNQISQDGATDPLTIAGRAETEAFVAEIESAGPNEFPKKTVDAFHLTGQKLSILTGDGVGTHDLSSLKVGLPSIIADFDREIDVEVNRQAREFSIVYRRGGETVASHTIKGFEVVAFARDKEILQFVDSNGKMYVVDMIFARSAAFRSPLPIFHVGQLPTNIGVDQLDVAFATRGLNPPTVIPEDAVVPRDLETRGIWTAGDFIVSRADGRGGRELVGVYNRGVSQMQMYTGEAVLAFLATMVSPPETEAGIGKAAVALADPMVAAKASEAANSLDALTRDALAAFSAKTVENLEARAFGNRDRAQAERDRYEYSEWLKDFKAVKERAETEARSSKSSERQKQLENALETGDLGSEWQAVAKEAASPQAKQRGIFYRVLTHKAMKALAVLTGGALTISGIGMLNEMKITAEMAQPLVWAIHTANWLYANVWPSVLKDAAYRVTLLKSCFTLSAFIPALHVVGLLYGKTKGWSAIKAKATLGIRAYAAIQLPFWVRLARIARQPNLMPALQLGINPFGKVTKDSELGKMLGLKTDVRPGVSLKVGEARVDDLAVKRQVLEAISVQRNRARAYSFLLANIAVGERHGIDPVTMLMARGGKIADGEAAKLLQDPGFAKEWLQVARELSIGLSDLKDGKVLRDIGELKTEDILADYRIAKQTAQDIASRGKRAALAVQLKIRWKEFGQRFTKGFGNYGIEENEFLKRVEPSDSVVNASWQQFFADYLLTVFQMGVIGERADRSQPDKLAADENGILWTNRGHFTDMVDQAVRAYGLSNPANLALVFQKDAAPTEEAYDPIEKITMQGSARVDTFARGLLSWSKNVLSLRQANYGGLFLKGLKKNFKTLQASIVLSLVARMALAGQGFVQALTGYGYIFFLGTPGYGWPWMPITQGNGTYVESIKAADAEFLRAKSKIGQGLRLGDGAMVNEGYNELGGIYAKHNDGDLPKELRKGLKAAERMLSIPAEERLSELEKVNSFYGQAARLSLALKKGNNTEIAKTYEEIRSQYGAEPSEAMKELNARSLLELALKHPPFRNKAHPMITWTWTYVGAFVTTYLATALFATSYGGGMNTQIFLDAMLLSAEFYVGVGVGQALINKLGQRLDYIRDHARTARVEPKPVPRSFEEYRTRFIEEKATEFKVGAKDIEAVMDSELEKTLKLRYQAAASRASCESMLVSADAVKPLTLGQKAKILLLGVPKN